MESDRRMLGTKENWKTMPCDELPANKLKKRLDCQKLGEEIPDFEDDYAWVSESPPADSWKYRYYTDSFKTTEELSLPEEPQIFLEDLLANLTNMTDENKRLKLKTNEEFDKRFKAGESQLIFDIFASDSLKFFIMFLYFYLFYLVAQLIRIS